MFAMQTLRLVPALRSASRPDNDTGVESGAWPSAKFGDLSSMGKKNRKRERKRARKDPERKTELAAYQQARSMANRRIAFFGHALVWGAVCFFLLVVAGFFPALVVALAWGVGLMCHGFFGVLAPMLRDQMVADEVGRRLKQTVTDERRSLQGRNARSLEQLSASVAHEIRNPITAAKSLAQQICEDPTSADNAEYAKVAVEELDRVERSVSHLLRYAREESVLLEETNLEEVAESALETFRDRLDKSVVRLRTEFEGDGWLHGDPEKLRRVVINLVGNALDSLEDSEFPDPRIVVATGASLAGDEVWLRVRDNGPGIEPERLTKIFDPFHTSKESGTGLGLAITKKVVDAHGGSIEVKSDLGQGAEFVLTFPRHGPTPDE